MYGFAGGDPIFSDPFGLSCEPKPCATVELVVRMMNDLTSVAVAGGHAFIKVTHADGAVSTYSAGPSAPAYGGASDKVAVAVGDQATAGVTLHSEGRRSWAASGERLALKDGARVVMSTTLASVPESEISAIHAQLGAFVATANGANVPYRPRSTNSIAWAYSAAAALFGADNASSKTRGGLPWGSGSSVP